MHEKAFDDFWQLLEPAQSTEEFALEILFAFHPALGDAGFHMPPNLFVGIELGRVRGEKTA